MSFALLLALHQQDSAGNYSTHLVLAKAQSWILELLNGLLIKVPIFLPKLQQLGGWERVKKYE